MRKHVGVQCDCLDIRLDEGSDWIGAFEGREVLVQVHTNNSLGKKNQLRASSLFHPLSLSRPENNK